MRQRKALVTGFEPYGGRGSNPAFELARGIDGASIAGLTVAGRGLPVQYDGLQARLQNLIVAEKPDLVISVGLWPGESMIRLERVAHKLANFDIPDNAGSRIRDGDVQSNGAVALKASWPVRRIQERMLAEGVPARLSETAGTFLCNVTLYACLETLEKQGGQRLCGFMHVPYMPAQVAELIAEVGREGTQELGQRADLASMDLAVMRRALDLALEVCADELGG
jgi:pyroglutamyl-peptidase